MKPMYAECIVSGIIAVAIFSMAFVVSRSIGDYKENKNCYAMYLDECTRCHNANMSYSICSGFCSEPRDVDFEMTCAVHPQEACVKNIPLRCVV